MENKKPFAAPEFEIIEFTVADIIMSSVVIGSNPGSGYVNGWY